MSSQSLFHVVGTAAPTPTTAHTLEWLWPQDARLVAIFAEPLQSPLVIGPVVSVLFADETTQLPLFMDEDGKAVSVAVSDLRRGPHAPEEFDDDFAGFRIGRIVRSGERWRATFAAEAGLRMDANQKLPVRLSFSLETIEMPSLL